MKTLLISFSWSELLILGVFLVSVFLLLPSITWAHCDTLAGPVVAAAKKALEKGDVTPVLKWVKKEQEGEIKEAFKKALIVRSKGAEAKELADMYFFETLVRIHRSGEGAPYTGLKPASAIEPIILETDKALESGDIEKVIKTVNEAVAKGIRERFTHTREAKKHEEENVDMGRKFVEAYVEFTHYVEGVYQKAATHKAAHGEEKEPATEHQH